MYGSKDGYLLGYSDSSAVWWVFCYLGGYEDITVDDIHDSCILGFEGAGKDECLLDYAKSDRTTSGIVDD